MSFSEEVQRQAAILEQAQKEGRVVGLKDVTKKVLNRADIDLMVKNQPDTFNLYLLALEFMQDEKMSQGDKMNWFDISGTPSHTVSSPIAYRLAASRYSWTSARVVGWCIRTGQRSKRRRRQLLSPRDDLVSHLASSVSCNDGGKARSAPGRLPPFPNYFCPSQSDRT